jgi:hypothetical protein
VEYDVFRAWATKAHLIRINVNGAGPRWRLILTGDPPESRMEVVGPDDPTEIYYRGDELASTFYRALLSNYFDVTDTEETRQWLLFPKS